MQNKDPGTYQLISTELQKPRNYKSAIIEHNYAYYKQYKHILAVL